MPRTKSARSNFTVSAEKMHSILQIVSRLFDGEPEISLVA